MAIREVDNRDADEMILYLEARIEALAGRIQELEAENKLLRSEDWRQWCAAESIR